MPSCLYATPFPPINRPAEWIPAAGNREQVAKMKKVTISKMTAREIILITSAFRKPHFTGAEINGNRSYALPLSIRDSKKTSLFYEMGSLLLSGTFSPVLL